VRTTELVFYLMHLLPAPLWAAWIFAPNSKLARSFASALWPFAVLAATYTVLIGLVLFVLDGSPEASMGSLPGVMAIFDSEWATLAGWMHYLCFDAMVGRWIVNDAPNAGYARSPILLLTLFFGPAGLLLYLALRPRLAAQVAP
jgi:hypothetical protein